jgi:PPOX class probable F420-dependent enzyme
VRDGDGLAVITEDTSGKAKRLRNNPAVLLAPCDGRGKLKGDAVPGTAVLLDHAGTTRTLGLISARYGVMGKVITLLNERRARKSGASSRAGIRITLDA